MCPAQSRGICQKTEVQKRPAFSSSSNSGSFRQCSLFTFSPAADDSVWAMFQTEWRAGTYTSLVGHRGYPSREVGRGGGRLPVSQQCPRLVYSGFYRGWGGSDDDDGIVVRNAGANIKRIRDSPQVSSHRSRGDACKSAGAQ
ncbi:hypothetical protein ACOMHN_043681 [Nucella lapillus]